MKDDRFLSVDGESVETWMEIRAKILDSGGEPITIELERDNETLEITVTPKDNKNGGHMIGIAMSTERQRFGALESIENGFLHSRTIVVMLLKNLGQIFIGKQSIKGLAGPVGIYKIIDDKANQSFQDLVALVAMISICLFTFNLLPLPILDGGHIALNVVEFIRRKPLEPRALEIIMQVGFVMIMCLFVLVTYNDIGRLFGE